MKKLSLLLVFILGLAIGVMLDRWQIQRETIVTSSASEIPEAQTGTTRLLAKQDRLEKEVVSLYQQINELEAALAVYRDAEQRDQELIQEKKDTFLSGILPRYEALFELSSDQARMIGEWEWEKQLIWAESMRTGKRQDLPNLEDRIMQILTPEQQEIYQAHLNEEARNIAELAAQSRLLQYPVTLNLTEDQKDALFQNHFYMLHNDSREQYSDRHKQLETEGLYIPQNIPLIMAAEDVLNSEQLDLLLEISRKK